MNIKQLLTYWIILVAGTTASVLSEERITIANPDTVIRTHNMIPFIVIDDVKAEIERLDIDLDSQFGFYSRVASKLEGRITHYKSYETKDWQEEIAESKQKCADLDRKGSIWLLFCAESFVDKLITDGKHNVTLKDFGYARVNVRGVYRSGENTDYDLLIETGCGHIIGLLDSEFEYPHYLLGKEAFFSGLLSPENAFHSRDSKYKINYQFKPEKKLDKSDRSIRAWGTCNLSLDNKQ